MQAETAGQSLRKITFDRIYSSDTQRAVETMKIALPGCEAELVPELREIGVGSLSGIPYAECKTQYGEAYRQMLAKRDFSPMGGESLQMQYERVSLFMKRMEQLEGCKSVAVFCHEGTIKCMLAYVLGVMFPSSALSIDNSACSVFRLKGDHWALYQWNVVELRA